MKREPPPEYDVEFERLWRAIERHRDEWAAGHLSTHAIIRDGRKHIIPRGFSPSLINQRLWKELE